MSTYNAVMNCKWLSNPPSELTDLVQKIIYSYIQTSNNSTFYWYMNSISN